MKIDSGDKGEMFLRNFKEILSWPLIVSTLFLAGCGTVEIKEPWTKELVGKRGYFARKPLFRTESSRGKSYSPDGYKRCEIVEITGLYSWLNHIFIEVKQGEKYYLATEEARGEIDKAFVDSMFVDSIPGKVRIVNLNGTKKKAADLICNGVISTGMSRNELLFTLGRPEKINRTVAAGIVSEQWVYKKPGGNDYESDYYYFINDVLRSWQD